MNGMLVISRRRVNIICLSRYDDDGSGKDEYQ